MDIKRLLGAIMAGALVLLGTSYLIHGVWLEFDYIDNAPLWRLQDQMRSKMWIMWAGQVLFTVMFAWIYTRGVEDRPWFGQGLRYGIAMALLAVVPAVMANYVVYPVPYQLAAKWLAAGVGQVILLGLVVAAIYRPPE